MKFAIQINSSPYQYHHGYIAYRFIENALKQGHPIIRVFFYQEGALHAFRYASPASDERNLTTLWGELAKNYGVDLVVCVSAAQRRGLLTEDEARQRGKLDNDLADGFRLGGLGQWLEATLLADRYLVFP